MKTEIAEADVAELLQLFSTPWRPRLGFASDDFAGTKWKNLTGATRWSDGTEMVTLDYSHLTSVLWECARASRPGWRGGSLAGLAGAEEAIRNMADARRRTIKAVYKDP